MMLEGKRDLARNEVSLYVKLDILFNNLRNHSHHHVPV